MAILFKNNTLPIKDVDTTQGIVTLYASAFGNVDSDNDIIERGAFAKSIQEWGPSAKNRIKHLWQHNTREPIGAPIEMSEDGNGLLVVSKVSSIRNGDYVKLYADGVITEHSIGFEIIKSHNNTKDARTITETRLWEYSAVTWGANSATPVVGMKSENKEETGKALIERMDTLVKALTKGSYTDETFHLLAIELEMVKQAIEALVAPQPIVESITEKDEPQFAIDLLSIYKNQNP